MRRTGGFTLLEVLVATVIMAVAITGLLGSLSTSLRNASRLMDADRSAMLARQKMDELLLDTRLPKGVDFDGNWPAELTGGQAAGWRARVSVMDAPPNAGIGTKVLERVQLEVWFGAGPIRRTFVLDGYRSAPFRPGGMP